MGGEGVAFDQGLCLGLWNINTTSTSTTVGCVTDHSAGLLLNTNACKPDSGDRDRTKQDLGRWIFGSCAFGEEGSNHYALSHGFVFWVRCRFLAVLGDAGGGRLPRWTVKEGENPAELQRTTTLLLVRVYVHRCTEQTIGR